MNITKFDVGMLFSLSLFVILMSFAGPAFGLTTDNATTKSDIPNLSVGDNTFDVAGDFPDRPTTPNSGRLIFTDNQSTLRNIQWIDGGDTSGGTEIFTAENASLTNATDVDVVRWDNGNEQYRDTYVLSNESDVAVHNNNSWNIEFKLVSEQEPSPGDYKSTTEFEVIQRPGSGDFLSSVPVVGGLVSAGSDIAAMVGWIGSVLFYLFILLGETVLNVITILIDVTVYLISMVSWMFSTYLGVVNGAPGWSRVIVAVPGVLLAGVLAKFVAVGISLLPTT